MKRITPEQIDLVADDMNELSPSEFEALVDQLGDEQPFSLAYVMSEDFEVLGENEQELLIYNTLMLWRIVKEGIEDMQTPDAETIDELQFNNWKVAEDLKMDKGQSFDDYVEPMIADYTEDELLYFVLDTFQEDDGDEFGINKESKLPIFIALKTLSDGWVGIS